MCDISVLSSGDTGAVEMSLSRIFSTIVAGIYAAHLGASPESLSYDYGDRQPWPSWGAFTSRSRVADAVIGKAMNSLAIAEAGASSCSVTLR
jgi:hypothetical protein